MRALRFLLWLTLFLAVLAVGAYLLRLPAAGFALRWAMAGAGLQEPQARVTALSLSDLRVEDISAGRAGDEDLAIDAVEADFHWRRLLSERSVDALRIGPGFIRLVLDDDGGVSIGGVNVAGSESSSGDGGASMDALPFSSLTLNDIDVIASSEGGEARATLSANYDLQIGGRITLSGSSDAFNARAFRTENAFLDVDVNLETDGQVLFDANVKGNVFSPDGVLQNVDVAMTGNGSSWRNLAEGDYDIFAFDALLQLNNIETPIDRAPALASFFSSPDLEALRGAPVGLAILSGDVGLEIRGHSLIISAGPRPLNLRTDTGVSLTMTGIDDAPFYARGENSEQFAAAYGLEGAPLAVEGSILATTVPEGWRIDAPMAFGAFRSDFLSFDQALFTFSGLMAGDRIEGDMSVKTDLKTAAFGDYEIIDTTLDLAAAIAVDPETSEARISLAEDCLEMDRLTIKAQKQNMDVSVSDASLCPDNRLLTRFDWSDSLTAFSEGALTAQRLQYSLGDTVFVGRPPRVEYAAAYDTELSKTSLTGSFRGGRITLNDVIIIDASQGAFEAAIAGEEMSARVGMNTARISQKAELEMVAPVLASGDLTLKESNARFIYVLTTPDGVPIGKGGGAHNLETGTGEAIVRTGRLEFAPEGLQPEGLAPVLRGFVDAADGAASANAQFAWDPSGLSSSATISLDDITFKGPTRVVSKTSGVSGDLSFKSLLPVATDGEQEITVEGVDLDSLVLEQGEIVFDMPGDETVRIVRAAFPWFGGMLGVYDASASMVSGEALAPLRVDNIDLNQVLTYIDMDGLSGEGVLSGVLPLAVREGRAFIENGKLQSQRPGVVRYQSVATEQAAAADRQAQIAFDILRDLRYETLSIEINGPLDGRLDFKMYFEGSGAVNERNQDVRLPVKYRISLEAALLELLNQALLTSDIELQLERALAGEEPAN